MPKPRYLKGYQKRPQKNRGCLIAIAICVGLLLLFFAILLYPANFDFREENKAEAFGNYLLLPLLGSFLLFMITYGLITSIKNKDLKAIPFIKEIGQLLLVLLVLYLFLQPVLRGLILFVNANIGEGEIVTVEGPVVDKVARTGRASYYELYILDQDNSIRELRTFPQQESKYKVGDTFRLRMTRGSLGLLYLEKAP